MMNSYYRNWQYSTTKEVIGVHETVEPYDWQLDTEYNENFQKWEDELK